MKVSVSLDDAEVAFLDSETAAGVYPSRSAAVSAAIRSLRERRLADDYAQSFREWRDSGEAAAWDAVVGDGL